MYNKRCKRLQFCKESTRTEKWLGVIGELGNSWWTEDLWDVWGGYWEWGKLLECKQRI